MGYSWVAEPFEGGLWPTQVWDAIFGRRQKGERPSCLFYCDVAYKITTSAQPTNNVAQVISPNGLYIPTSLKGKLVYTHAVSQPPLSLRPHHPGFKVIGDHKTRMYNTPNICLNYKLQHNIPPSHEDKECKTNITLT